jgi:hypothetical protein
VKDFINSTNEGVRYMTENKITVETVGHPQFAKINRFAEAIRKFYAEPKNVMAFEKWKKEGAAI